MKNKFSSLSDVQKSLLDLLKDNIQDPLTIREIQEFLGISSPGVAHHHIKQLEKKGFLRRNPSNPKDYQVLIDEPNRKFAYLNLYGMGQCGPDGSVLAGDPVNKIPISTEILGFDANQAFLLKARGDSMEPRIKEGDLVIVKRSNIANNGDIIVCVNNEVVLIKKLRKYPFGCVLESLNREKYSDIPVAEDFRIEGIVRVVYSYSL